jgi:hypothetical protein
MIYWIVRVRHAVASFIIGFNVYDAIDDSYVMGTHYGKMRAIEAWSKALEEE